MKAVGNKTCVLTAVQILRKSFIDAMADREFLADAKRSNLNIDPMKGEELETTVARLFQLPSSVTTRLREVLAANSDKGDRLGADGIQVKGFHIST
jgi:hypothetical protein